MPLVASALSLDTVKMEDRKRPPPDDHAHSTPRLKRQAVSVNGAPGRTEEDFPKDEELDVGFPHQCIGPKSKTWNGTS